ncbi:carbamate kinase [Thorsellia anophelis]|uniref:carbamate kinase n=1 Tax=Thorsellia anophelis TaxID=336804 RepID=UPI000B8A1B7F|nr:carbamate kinase [Thorsellia anophelis]
MKETVVVAIGGNSIITDNDSQSISHQLSAIKLMVKPIADIIEEGYNVVLTHGNGPQVGLELQRSEIANQHNQVPLMPLVNCVANTQGGIGYLIQQCLQNELRSRKVQRNVVTVLTQVEVDSADPSFKKPSKPIGSFFSLEEKNTLQQENPTWSFVEDSGRGYRRVVPSPTPMNIVELNTIMQLIENQNVVIAIGGGGIPVVSTIENEVSLLSGVDAVIDKDLSTELLARTLNADILLITTGVENVAVNFGKPTQKSLGEVTVNEIEEYKKEGHFPAGSMLPKIDAALSFVRSGGQRAIITLPEKLLPALRNETGTHIIS